MRKLPVERATVAHEQRTQGGIRARMPTPASALLRAVPEAIAVLCSTAAALTAKGRRPG